MPTAHSRLLLFLATSLLASSCAVAPHVASSTGQRVAWKATPEFSELAVKSGVAATRTDCEAVREAVWVETKAQGGECLRYWKGGFGTGPAKRAIVYFHGDVWLGTEASPTYLKFTEQTLQADAREWAAKLGAPYIYLARPGTHGSSGDHMQRRRQPESEAISLALDQLKKRYEISEWVAVGFSGGGHVTASLFASRDDVVCAVATSSVSSPRARWILLGRDIDATGYADSYEPLEFIRKANHHPKLRIFVVGSLEDSNTPWASQVLLSGRAKALGLPVMELTGEGTGSAKHGMSNSGRMVAGWCAQDLSDDQIREKAKAGLKG
jgi:pimeloyl-ACP methyl ester carboxylesterase